jgi:glutathione synthase/RimK-type ligase-like ATP-grasp enzyme
MKDIVLIVSQPGDYHAAAVTAVLKRSYPHVVPCEIHMREFPLDARASFRVDSQPAATYKGSSDVDLGNVRTVWWRRPEACGTPKLFSSRDEEFLKVETNHFLQGLLWSVPAFWVNDPRYERYASRKIVQLKQAVQAGLRVPRTIVTNDPSEVRMFIDQTAARVIYKRCGTGADHLVKTRFVTPAVMERVDAIAHCPAIFQQYVEPRQDLRVIWLQGELWAVSIDAASGSSPEDSRFDHSVKYSPFRLPRELKQSLTALMSSLGLAFGAIDVRQGADREFYFLEVNPSGQFIYLELKTELPLTAAFASLLVHGGS